MYEKILTAAGLTTKEAEIYELILGIGQAPASEIYKKTAYKRGLVYKILEQLTEKGLVIKIEKPRKVAIFRVEHPNKINERLETQAQRVNYYKRSMEELMPQLVANYNLAFNKPGIQFFEGEEGVRKVLADTLTARNIIYTYADVEAVIKYTETINREYAKKRDKLQINKKVITIDSPFAREFFKDYYENITDTRFIDHQDYPFSSVMQIYDNRVSYMSLSKDAFVAVLITDKNIYQMQKSLFEFNWKHAKTYEALSPLSKAQ
jgi:sugar-specific transcriptional regulator TrmB